ncbi:hypothetical protein VNO77_16063 [Canavalia gladiata]|uniref:Uncharacterized protein n=1 Tax=Canavalia gladiata TaxID=3824 RepID=A0AAN9M3H5_CANGL
MYIRKTERWERGVQISIAKKKTRKRREGKKKWIIFSKKACGSWKRARGASKRLSGEGFGTSFPLGGFLKSTSPSTSCSWLGREFRSKKILLGQKTEVQS